MSEAQDRLREASIGCADSLERTLNRLRSAIAEDPMNIRTINTAAHQMQKLGLSLEEAVKRIKDENKL